MEWLIVGGIALIGLVGLAAKEAGETKGWRDALTHYEQQKQDEEMMRQMFQYFGQNSEGEDHERTR